MNIIGSIIKRGIELRAQFEPDNEDPVAAQRGQLQKLLQTAADTAFGKFYNFEAILRSKDPIQEFQNKVPIFDYQKMNRAWWHKTLQEPDITWPGKPDYFAKTSGTTGGEPKRIPVTSDMLDSIRKAGISQLASINNFNLPNDFFERQVFMLGSTTELEDAGDHKEGEISGISAGNLPFWFENVYKPGKDISSMDDWDERVKAIARNAPKWNIGAMSGIPSWMLLTMKEIIRYNKLDTIHDIWPGLKVYVTGGVAFDPYQQAFEDLFDKEVIYLDTYLASEGFLAYTGRPGTMDMKLALNHGVFFEFVPFDEEGFDEQGELLENPEVKTLAELEEGRDYALLVSTCAGTWRYMIGDTVAFKSTEHSEISLTGRTKHFLNVVGSQLSEDKMNETMKALEQHFGPAFEEFTVAAVKDENGDFYHHWILGTDEPNVDNNDAAQYIDEYLSENNKNYGVARSKALYGVKATVVPLKKFHQWHEKTRQKGGQVKTQKVMKEEQFREFLEFVQKT